MSRNISEVYQENPATNMQPTDLIYLGRWPYLPSQDDMAVQWSTIQAAIADGITWNTITDASATMIANNGYIINRPSLVMLTMPAIANVGDTIEILLIGAGGFQIAQQNGQNIQFGKFITATGAAGFITSQNIGDSLKLRCVITNSMWFVTSPTGNLNFN